MGDKFVWAHEPGVYKKVSHNKARCVWGSPGSIDNEVPIDPDVQVFVIPREPIKRPKVKEGYTVDTEKTVDADKGMVKVVLIDSDEKPVHEMKVEMFEAAAFASIARLKVRLPRKHTDTVFSILDSGYDHTEKTLVLEVNEQ